MISIDDDIHKKAKEQQLNISGEVEQFLKTRINGEITQPKGERACRCGSKKDLCWLCPDERWICGDCLNTDVRKVNVAIATRK